MTAERVPNLASETQGQDWGHYLQISLPWYFTQAHHAALPRGSAMFKSIYCWHLFTSHQTELSTAEPVCAFFLACTYQRSGAENPRQCLAVHRFKYAVVEPTCQNPISFTSVLRFRFHAGIMEALAKE